MIQQQTAAVLKQHVWYQQMQQWNMCEAALNTMVMPE